MPELKGKIAVSGVFVALLLLPMVSFSEAKLWDLQIQVDVVNELILPGDRPVIAGIITDHASKPVKNVQIDIRAGPDYIFTTSNENGEFKVKLHSSNWTPGHHAATINAYTLDGKEGMTKMNFQVQGEQRVSSIIEDKLSTPEAIKYLNANIEDLANNPIGLRLYYYYQDLYLQHIEEKKKEEFLIIQKEKFIQEKLEEERLKKIAVAEFNPKSGGLTTEQIENIADNANESIKEGITEQLNYTVNVYKEAQKAKETILTNGGTMKEAMEAYYTKLTITTEMMEKVISGKEEVAAEPTEEVAAEPTEEVAAEPTEEEITDIIVILNGKEIKIKSNVTSLYVNEDGKLVKYLVQGNKLVKAK